MFDKQNPEMITYLKAHEIEKLSVLYTLATEENQIRKIMRINNNILESVIKNIFILRCSLNGIRAEQGVKIIGGNVETEDKLNLNKKFGKMLEG